MKSRTLIAAAVAAACAWPMLAAAKGATHSGGSTSWTPAAASPADASRATVAVPVFVETITPHSVNESAPWMTAEETRAHHTRVQGPSLPNPQTPWSASESGPADYAQDMRERAQQVAAVERQRVAVARIESERLAAAERERLAALEQERLAELERERVATSGSPDGTAAAGTAGAGAAPAQPDITASSPAPALESTRDLPPPTPGETPAQPDRSAGLVDRNAGTMSLAPTPQIDASGNAPGSDTVNADLGVTRGEGPIASGTGPQTDAAVISERAPVAAPGTARAEKDPLAATGEPVRVTRDNAYVPVPDGVTEAPAR